MKIFRFALNIWITIVSVGSFLLGWAVLAHAPKPVSHTTSQVTVSNAAPLPTLTPLQFGNTGNNFQNFQVAPSTSFNNSFNSAPQPIFRTGGS
jgi:hypothetical protein